MPKALVVVESPAKARTIGKYLGKNYLVMASYGHVRDLIPKEGAVDPENNFHMTYQAIERSQRHVDAIRKALKGCDTLLLAPDPDREGEAIAWHLLELLKEKKALKNLQVHRVVFHQITKQAIQKAIENPRDILMDLVNAQQARRALDYLVGFTLSPLLWRKIRAGLSAGRVQSPALRMIVEREIEIEKFNSEEYWTIHAETEVKEQSLQSRLIEYQGEKLEQFTITAEKQAKQTVKAIEKSADGILTVDKIVKRERKRHPAPPFITSTLQQEAARKLGFTAQRTMQTAQQLYEGIDIGEGSTGLITYMRTDSVTLAHEALDEIRECIAMRYGKENHPEKPRFYKTKSKNAQEAHEAIRPTSAMRHSDDLKAYLSPDQLKLYALIWKRTVACQMIEATLNTVAIDLVADNCRFRANGSVIVTPGFITVYQEGFDDKKLEEENKEKMLPPLEEGQTLPLKSVTPEQHFTEPPPRYTEASLVKALEEHDIGRPSTYASILSTLRHRKYVEVEQKRFVPTDIGRIVARFLTEYFTKYVDYDFTAELEQFLDEVSEGNKDYVSVLRGFWAPFKQQIDKIADTVKRSDVTQEKIDEKCPKCEKSLSIRLGRNGRFVGCTAFPDCDYTRSLEGDTNEDDAKLIADRKCEKCESDLVIKHGPYGKFIGCSNYPKCRFIEPLEKPEDTEVQCPSCKKSTMLKRKSRRGKIFYSCAKYPKCKYAVWNEPQDTACPQCQWPMLTLKTTKTKGDEIVCPQKACNYSKKYIEKTAEKPAAKPTAKKAAAKKPAAKKPVTKKRETKK